MMRSEEKYAAPAGAGETRLRLFLRPADPPRRRRLIAVTFALVLAVGLGDFLAGFEVSLLVFYILPVCLAVLVSRSFAIGIAVLSITTWLAGDIAGGAHFANRAVVFWNAFMALGTYLIVLSMFHRLVALQRDMERRVQQRTVALTQLIAERERLEKAMLDVAERERRSIGHDLHDGLGQHLTGTALAGQVLADKLQTKGVAEEADAWRIVELVEEGIEKTRRLARGLLLAEVHPDELIPALQDFVIGAAEQFHIACELTADVAAIQFDAADAATHLLCIAQEAVRNAVRHGRAKRVEISLHVGPEIELAVRDFGNGMPAARGHGLGLSIMAHRAEMIGGQFAIAPAAGGGTVVTCRLPSTCLRHE